MKLLFVYNANSGAMNALLDSAHKLLSPSTYNCNLCDLTFGLASENSVWKKFRQESDVEMIFLHKDEFLNEYKSKWLPKYEFPIVLEITDQALELFIASNELQQFETVEQLIESIKNRVSLG